MDIKSVLEIPVVIPIYIRQTTQLKSVVCKSKVSQSTEELPLFLNNSKMTFHDLQIQNNYRLTISVDK